MGMIELNMQELMEINHEIPEIQRDYVWGNRKDILDQFLESLSNGKPLNIGFLYSYKPGENSSVKYIIDGQQRFTTLFLMLLYLANEEQREEIKKLKNNFSYKVRTLSDLFLQDITFKANLQEGVDAIENSTWFLEDYKNDPTVKAIISLIKWMTDKKIETKISYNFLFKDVKFWYFKVDSAGLGEELYISMNTRGVEIADYENIKVLLLEREEANYDKRWDIWEDYFWKHKGNDKDIDTKMKYVLTLIFQCITCSERTLSDHNKEDTTFTLINIEKYLHILFNLENWGYGNFVSKYFQKQDERKYQLPMVALLYVGQLLLKDKELNFSNAVKLEEYHYSLCEDERKELDRLFHFIENSVRRGHDSLRNLLELLYELNESDVGVSVDAFLDFDKEKHKKILTSHEIDKIKIAKESGNLRDKIETLFWETQKETSYILGGSLRLLFEAMKWINSEYKWNEEDIVSFIIYKEVFTDLFSKTSIKKELSRTEKGINNSLLTRGLLTIGDYSTHVGGDNYSFGYDRDWSAIIKEKGHREIIVKFLQNIHTAKFLSNKSYIEIINEMIDNYIEEEKTWIYYFVKYSRITQPKHDGHNRFTWFGDFHNYLLNKDSFSSYNINPYLWVLSEFVESKNDGYKAGRGDSELRLKNDLKLLVGEKREGKKTIPIWVVRCKRNINIDIPSLLENEDMESESFEEYKDYYIPCDIKSDFIEKGKELVSKLI